MAEGLAEKIQDDNTKCTVLKLLRLCANDGQIPLIAAQLGNATVRPYAIMTLASIGTPAASKALVDAAAKADTAVAFEYVSSFAMLKPATAVPVLLRIIDHVTPYQRVAVMNALAEIGNPDIADKLFDVLAKAKGTERDGAIAAIAKLAQTIKNKEAAIKLAARFHEAAPCEASLATLLDVQGIARALPTFTAAVVSDDFFLRNAALLLLDSSPCICFFKAQKPAKNRIFEDICKNALVFFLF